VAPAAPNPGVFARPVADVKNTLATLARPPGGGDGGREGDTERGVVNPRGEDARGTRGTPGRALRC